MKYLSLLFIICITTVRTQAQPKLIVNDTLLSDTKSCFEAHKTSMDMDSLIHDQGYDQLEITSARLKDNCLALSIKYGGGGGKAFLQLFLGSRKSTTEEVYLYTLFEDQDHAEALIYRTVNFDLSSILYDYPKAKKVMINNKAYELR